MTKKLVACFSASGTTARAAKKLAAYIGADLYEIKPELPYTREDLNWMSKTSRSSIEMKDKSSRPAIINDGLDVSKYEKIFLGFPVWWYTAPTIINTFLEAYDFSGREIFPFVTSGGSGVDKCGEDLQKAYPQYKFSQGKVLNGAIIEDTVGDWR